MSEVNSNTQDETPLVGAENQVKLPGIFAFKEGMATIYNENGDAIPVTILRYEPWVVSQVKTTDKDGYEALQIACLPKKKKNSTQAEVGHLKASGMDVGTRYVKEIKAGNFDSVKVGAVVALESLAKGDVVKITSKSKGRGFAGSVKRWNFNGGPASHGSKFHRRPGSSGNRTWPGRVMPGKKFPGHWGDENVTVRNVEVVDVNPSENVLMVKGPVPGARNSLVKLVRE